MNIFRSVLVVLFVFVSFLHTLGQAKTVANPFFDIVTIDNSGKVFNVPVLFSQKINLKSSYESLYTYDFNKDGVKEEIFYSFGSQNVARFLWKSENTRITENLYNDYFEEPGANEGFWFYIVDVFGDATPEILIFSQIGENSFLKIINYSTSLGQMVENMYLLSAYASYPNQLVKNDKVIIAPYGSQGLFDELPLKIR